MESKGFRFSFQKNLKQKPPKKCLCFYDLWFICTNFVEFSWEKCKVRAKLVASEFIRTNPKETHNHQNHVVISEYEEAYKKLKTIASESVQSLRQAQRQVLREISLEASGMIDFKSCRNS